MGNDIFKQIKELVKSYIADSTEIEMHSNLQKDLSLNSFEKASLIAEIEELYSIDFFKEDYEQMICVGDLVRLISDMSGQ